MGTMGRRNQNRSFQRPGSQRPARVLPSKSKIYALGSLRRENGGIDPPPSNTSSKLETIPAHRTTLIHKQFLVFLHLLSERGEQSIAMFRSASNDFDINYFEELRCMSNFVIFALLGGSRCCFQRGLQLSFGDLLDVWIPRKAVPMKPRSIKTRQCFNVRNKPCFHSLSHQMALIVW